MRQENSSNFGHSNFDEQRPARKWSSFGLSFVFHVVLLTMVALLGFRAKVGAGSPEIRRVSVVLKSVNELNQTEFLDETDQEQATDSDNQLAAPTQPVESLSELPEIDTSLPSLELPVLDAPGLTQLESSDNPSSRKIEITEAHQEMIEADRKRFAAQAAEGSETSIEVFGSGELTGRKFVFVIDRSKSMGSQGLGVLEQASQQLSKAIDGLEPNHKFQVVGYHHRTVTMNERRLLRATPENKNQVTAFIAVSYTHLTLPTKRIV